MKRWIIFVGTAVLIATFTAMAFAANPIKLILNGREMHLDVPPQIINGRTMVPVRWIAEMLGATVYWNEKEKVVGIEFSLPAKLREEWQYPLPGGGELSLGYLGRETKFILPAVITLNDYLAEKQRASLYPSKDNAPQQVLVRYELLNAGRTDGGMWYSERTAYEVVARLYYSEVQTTEEHPPYVIRLYEQKIPEGGITGNAEELKFSRHWYEDTEFVIRSTGETVVERVEGAGRTTWVQGLEGWYVDEKATRVLRKVELKEMPILFDHQLPPNGYDYTLIKK